MEVDESIAFRPVKSQIKKGVSPEFPHQNSVLFTNTM